MKKMCQECGEQEEWIVHNGVSLCKTCFRTVNVKVPKPMRCILSVPRTVKRALQTRVVEYENVHFVHLGGQKFKVYRIKRNRYRLGPSL